MSLMRQKTTQLFEYSDTSSSDGEFVRFDDEDDKDFSGFEND